MKGGLTIRLKPHEKLLINGAVIENGDHKTRIRIRSRDVNILKLRDALHPSEATTPAKYLYYQAQLVVIGDLDPEEGAARLIPGIRSLSEAMPNCECSPALEKALESVCKNEFYRAMKLLKQVFPVEEQLLVVARAKELNRDNHKKSPCPSSQ